MDLEKASDKVDREALWNVLKICVERQLLKRIQAFYREASAFVRVEAGLSEG